MTDKELNSIGKWLNSKGYDLDLTDCFWMEDWIANETKFRDVAELLLDYHKEQLLIHSVVLQSEQLQSFVSGFYQWHREQNYVSVKRTDWNEYIKTL